MKTTIAMRPQDFDRYKLPADELANIVCATRVIDAVKEHLNGAKAYEGMRLPWPKYRDRVRFAPGHVTVWTGKTFSGKTQLLKQTILDGIARQQQRAIVASMEEQMHETIGDVARMACCTQAPTNVELDAFQDWIDDRLWLYDQQRLVKPQRLLGLIAFAAKELRVTQVVIDSWMRMEMSNDDYDRQREFMNHLMAYADYFQVHLHIVAHQRKSSGKFKNELGGIEDIKGSGDIANQAHKVITVWRHDKPRHERESGSIPDGVLSVDKQRGRPNYIGRTGLWHDNDSGQFLAEQHDRPVIYVPGLPRHAKGWPDDGFPNQRGLEV